MAPGFQPFASFRHSQTDSSLAYLCPWSLQMYLQGTNYGHSHKLFSPNLENRIQTDRFRQRVKGSNWFHNPLAVASTAFNKYLWSFLYFLETVTCSASGIISTPAFSLSLHFLLLPAGQHEEQRASAKSSDYFKYRSPTIISPCRVPHKQISTFTLLVMGYLLLQCYSQRETIALKCSTVNLNDAIHIVRAQKSMSWT
jgi:hypothetical protein